MTRTWFEHATFWSGVRRATVAPPGLLTTGQSDARRSLTHIARASNPSAVLLVDWRFQTWLSHAASTTWSVCQSRSHGVMVSTLDFESSDPSSNLGGTSFVFCQIEVIHRLYLVGSSCNSKNSKSRHTCIWIWQSSAFGSHAFCPSFSDCKYLICDKNAAVCALALTVR